MWLLYHTLLDIMIMIMIIISSVVSMWQSDQLAFWWLVLAASKGVLMTKQEDKDPEPTFWALWETPLHSSVTTQPKDFQDAEEFWLIIN